ncbi:MAG: 30S ribosomal protein S1 [Deltaproteobacteria bacterium]|nr:30S ribosomal protein S1 [Deltaproteobacteria bacterium]MCL5277528.1 30S ribosomal protein S1 [Deltaproteobacteria bacterium]
MVVGNEHENENTAEFKELMRESVRTFKIGDIVKGKIIELRNEGATVDIGYKADGFVPAGEITDSKGKFKFKVGDDIEVLILNADSKNSVVQLSRQKVERVRALENVIKAMADLTPVHGEVVSKTKGGLMVDIGVQAFMPWSQIDIKSVKSLDSYIGRRIRAMVISYEEKTANIILSRKQLLEREKEQQLKRRNELLKEGNAVEGVVRTITDYGAFVAVEGIDGLLHISDMTWARIKHPSEILKVGMKLRLKVLKYDMETEKLSLGMKQLEESPWAGVADEFKEGSKVRGRVVNVTDFGVFVELKPGVDGLIHKTDLSWDRRVKHPGKYLSVDTEVDAIVLNVDSETRKIALGYKQLLKNPWEEIAERYGTGTRLKGTITSITDFGLFVEIEKGVEGLVHIDDVAWSKKIKNPLSSYKKGETIDTIVLSVDKNNQKLSLGIKQLTPDPWRNISKRYKKGEIVQGTITGTVDFGMFVEVEDGVEGLIHISEIEHVKDKDADTDASAYTVGNTIECAILNVDEINRKLSLGLKILHKQKEKMVIKEYLKTNVDSVSNIGEMLKLKGNGK